MTRIRTILAALALGATTALFTPTSRADTPAPAAAKVFAEANDRFHEALATKDKAAAKALLTESIALLRTLTDEQGIKNPQLYVNIGNACLLSGDTGRAIAAFRRGERENASDPAIKAGLEAARKQAGSPPPVPPTFSERLLQWAGYLPRREMLGAFALLWIAGWVVLGVRIMGWSAPRRLGPALLAVGALVAAPVAAAEVMDSNIAHAVIVAARAPAYNGPSDAVYQPTFKEGLPAGVEVRMLEHRGEWNHIRLGDGRETWVRTLDLERI